MPIGSLRVGDVIVFIRRARPGRCSTALLAGQRCHHHEGRRQQFADPWRLTVQGESVYRLVFVVPFLGWSTELQGAFFAGAGLIVLLLVLLELRKGVSARKAQAAS